MRIGVGSYLATGCLAVVISFIAKDLTVPLFAISLFGLFDRMIGLPALRAQRQDPA
jgi:hypothetical protein